MSSRLATALSLVALVFAAGCAQKATRPFEVVAVIPFEDLSVQGGGFAGEALAWMAARQTQGDAKIRVVEAPNYRTGQATRTISGWLENRGGKLVVSGQVRDEESQKVLRTFRLTGSEAELSKLATSVAGYTGAPVKSIPEVKAEALAAYFAARRATSAADAGALADRALTADPSFGAVALLKYELLARAGDQAGSEAALRQVRAAKLTEADQASLALLKARGKKDLAGQAGAILKLAKLQGADTQLWRQLLEIQFVTRDFRAAADSAARILELSPADEDALNRRGYAFAFAGDLDAARKAFEEYRLARPDSANAIDSLAEALFYSGKFAEASKLFAEAGRKEPHALNGSEPFRAALSALLAGDAAGADKLYAVYREGRKNDPTLVLRDGIWAAMKRQNSEFPQDAAGLATASMLALGQGNRAQAATLAAEARKLAHSPQEGTLAFTAWAISQPSASPEIWARRMSAMLPDPRQADLRLELLGWSLLLDGHYSQSASIWRAAVDRTSMLTNNDQRILLVWCLLENGQKDEAKKVMPHGWLPPASLDPGLGVLFYPRIQELSTKL